MQKRRISVVMSKKEWILGLCWLPFYVLLLSLGVQLIFRGIAGRLPDTAELNAVYYAVNAAVVLLIFRRFLRGNLMALRKNRRKPQLLPEGVRARLPCRNDQGLPSGLQRLRREPPRQGGQVR